MSSAASRMTIFVFCPMVKTSMCQKNVEKCKRMCYNTMDY